MSATTKINWTDATWNPVSGCTPAGVGCAHCYARRVAERFPAVHGVEYSSPSLTSTGTQSVPFSRVICHPERLGIPFHWRRPRAIMCPSMGDLFHADVPDDFIDLVFTRMALCPQHTFVVLTKRVERMSAFLSSSVARSVSWEDDADKAHPLVYHVEDDYQPEYTKNDERLLDQFELGLENIRAAESRPLPNVVLGASFSTQKEVDDGMGFLLNTPANRRIVSLEPLVGPVSLNGYLLSCRDCGARGMRMCGDCKGSDREAVLSGVIVGGESGPGARPMHPDWVRSLRDQCEATGVPFFFKQWGTGLKKESYPVRFFASTAGWDARVPKGGRELDGRTHDALCWDVRGKGEA